MLEIISMPFVFSILLAIVVAAIAWPINIAIYKKATGFEYSTIVKNANQQAISVSVNYIMETGYENPSDAVFDNIISAACIENKVHRCDAFDLNQLKSILVQVFINNHLLDEGFKHQVITKLCAGNTISKNENYFPKRSTLLARRMSALMTTISVLLSVVIVTLVSYAYKNVQYIVNRDATFILLAIVIVVLLIAEVIMFFMFRPTEKIASENVPMDKNDPLLTKK